MDFAPASSLRGPSPQEDTPILRVNDPTILRAANFLRHFRTFPYLNRDILWPNDEQLRAVTAFGKEISGKVHRQKLTPLEFIASSQHGEDTALLASKWCVDPELSVITPGRKPLLQPSWIQVGIDNGDYLNYLFAKRKVSNTDSLESALIGPFERGLNPKVISDGERIYCEWKTGKWWSRVTNSNQYYYLGTTQHENRTLHVYGCNPLLKRTTKE
jgi:hypothetical protein